ncbi:Golgi apparatus membrane protein TVP38 [Lactarius deliciosus]|nr:Golgi apparatus membrane protein TVP38 [Lactarius deliciosus]
MTSDRTQTQAPFLRRHIVSCIHHFRGLPIRAKLLIIAVTLFNCALLAFTIIVTPARIAQASYDLGQRIRVHPLGWLLLATLIQIASFPPMIGHTMMLNLSGFTYGMKGFLVAAPASLIASAVVFVVMRYLSSGGFRSWSERNEKWQALEAVINAKGLPLVILIRVSPFPPWAYSNLLFSSIQSVKLWQFMAGTICDFPKYALYVFVGSRMASLSDGKQRGKMDTQTKVVNSILVIGGFLIGIAAGLIVYALVKRQLGGTSPKLHELPSEEADEDAPLLSNLSSESLHEAV